MGKKERKNKNDMSKDSLFKRIIKNKKYILFTTIFLLLILTSISYVYYGINSEEGITSSNETDIKTTEKNFDTVESKIEDLKINIKTSETDLKETENLEYQFNKKRQITAEQTEEKHNKILSGTQENLLSEDKNILIIGLNNYTSDRNGQEKSFLLARTNKDESLFEITLIPSTTHIKEENSSLTNFYAESDIEETKKTIGKISDITIDNYFKIDYQILTSIIDIFNGVKIINTKGLPIKMNKTETLNYIRQLHPEEPEQNRLQRQKNLLEAFAEHFFQKEIILQKSLISNIYSEIESIKTSTSTDHLFSIAYYALKCSKDGIVINILPGEFRKEYFIPEK